MSVLFKGPAHEACRDVASPEKRVELFRAVRDLPYVFNFEDRSLDATCWTKMVRLGEQLEQHGLAWRPVCCRVYWDDMYIPDDIRKIMPGNESQHWYAEVFVPESKTWVKVDPTWDSGLKAAGFPVAEWDGLNSTILAVTPFTHFSLEYSEILHHQKAAIPRSVWDDFQEQFGEPYRRLNAWIAGQRAPSIDDAAQRFIRAAVPHIGDFHA